MVRTRVWSTPVAWAIAWAMPFLVMVCSCAPWYLMHLSGAVSLTRIEGGGKLSGHSNRLDGSAAGQRSLRLASAGDSLEHASSPRLHRPNCFVADWSRFNRFGLISTWVDGNSQTIYFDDLTYTCKLD